MTDLSTLVDPFKRLVAPLGQFGDLYPEASDDDVLGLLMDALGEAVLDRYFRAGSVPTWTPNGLVTPDLSPGQQAVVVIYAGDRYLRAQILQMGGSVRYKAGPVEYEVQNAASVLTELLRENAARKKALIAANDEDGGASAFLMADLYFINAVGSGWCASPYSLR